MDSMIEAERRVRTLDRQPPQPALTGRTPNTSATATANANIALIKYWGKADDQLIIPRTSSLSLTLDGLFTRTTVKFLPRGAAHLAQKPIHAITEKGVEGADAGIALATETAKNKDGPLTFTDTLTIDGQVQDGAALVRVSRFLDVVRAMAGIDSPARVLSSNTVPYGAGLASSSSAFAALATAASRAAGLALSPRDLSRLARRGSGSACRSIFGGLTLWRAGHDDRSSFAEPLVTSMDLAVVLVVVSDKEKRLSSRTAMRRTVETSPLYSAWAQQSQADLQEALVAIDINDLGRLCRVVEANAFGMHAAMLAARPAICYWLPQTIMAMQAVRKIRAQGLDAWMTMDAGPNVKVLTSGTQAQNVAEKLRSSLPECLIQVHHPGMGAHLT